MKTKVVFDIPTEFINHWEMDRFKDSLERLIADANLLAGNYEIETARMLIDAFDKAEYLDNYNYVKDKENNHCVDCQEFDCFGCKYSEF